jgi:hypothetical protein
MKALVFEKHTNKNVFKKKKELPLLVLSGV